MKNKVGLGLMLVFVLTACGNKNIDAAEKAIERNLSDPSSAQYKNVNSYSEDVVCGEVNAKNRMGGYVGFQPFIFNGRKPGEAKIENVGTSDIDLWCNNNPQKRLTDMKNELPSAQQFCEHASKGVPSMKERACMRANELKAAIASATPSAGLTVTPLPPKSMANENLAAAASSSSLPVTVPGSGATTGLIVFNSRGVSWVEVVDASGVVQLRKTMADGEIVGASGALPLSVVVGRADTTEVQVRGKPFDLTHITKDNIARFEVK
jgi:hypothetical protein